MRWSDAYTIIFIGVLLLTFLFIAFGCSSKCKKKSCCPKEGHGPCPICEVVYDRDNIIYGR